MIQSQYAGGMLLPLVQKLVATLILPYGQNANKSLSLRQKRSTPDGVDLFVTRQGNFLKRKTFNCRDFCIFSSKWKKCQKMFFTITNKRTIIQTQPKAVDITSASWGNSYLGKRGVFL